MCATESKKEQDKSIQVIQNAIKGYVIRKNIDNENIDNEENIDN